MDLKTILAKVSFRRKLLLLLLAIFLPAFGIIVATGISQRQHAIAQAQEGALLLARSLAAQQEQIALATKTMLSTLAQLPEVQNLDGPACHRIFHELHQQYPFYASILAMTPDGYVFAAHKTLESKKVNQSDRKYFQDAISSLDFSAGECIIGRVSGTNSFNYSFPVLDKQKKLIAVLTAGLNLHKFGQFISTVNLPEGSAVIFEDHKAVRVFRSPENDATPIGKPSPKGFFDLISGSEAEGLFEWTALDGVRRLNAFKQLRLKENSPPYLYIVVGQPKDAILHIANLKMLRNLLILGLAALLAFILAWFLGNLVLIKPINQLVAATQRFGSGEMDSRTGLLHTPDELGRLAHSFDNMADLLEIRNREREEAKQALTKTSAELEERVQARTAELSLSNAALRGEISEREQAEGELEKAKEYLENIFANSADGIGIVDEHGIIRRWNKAAEEIYGYSLEELQGKRFFDLYADKNEIDKLLIELRREGLVRNYGITMKRKDGSTFPCSLSIRVLRDEGKKNIGSVTVARDLTKPKDREAKLHLANERLQALVTESNRLNRQISLLQEMSGVFHACLTSDETYSTIAQFGPKFFPEYAGALYLLNHSKNLFEMMASWGEASAQEVVFGHNECWALRRSRTYLVSDSKSVLNCPHVSASQPGSYLCLPLMAQGEALGILHLQKTSMEEPDQMEASGQFATTVAEAMALALANLNLRETLRNQAIRDGLTGLFNRRYLEETMERELSRSQRLMTPLGVVMLDLDHFKEYNDTFGHNGGDELLVALGQMIQELVRKEDISCRYGGEEFLLIMPGANLEVVLGRTQNLVRGVKQLHLQSGSLRPVTISAGVAIFPDHGSSGKEVIRAADAALYQAKAAGRDRVEIASSVTLQTAAVN